jgi:uncharacterized protein YaiE (UPF0345 family)
VNYDGTYDIKFEDGEKKRGVKEDQIEGGGDDRDRDRDRDRDSRSSSTKTRREGDTVKAKCTGWTKYYAGEITRVNSDGTYDIKFEDGERKRGIKEDQIEGGGDDRDRDRDRDRDSRSSSTKTRREGDRVKAKVSGWTKYFAGEITRVNSDGTYDIKFDDGERKRGVKEDQIEWGGDNDRDRDRDRDSRSSTTKKRREGDRVKAKVSGWTKYYSGEITSVNYDGTYDIKFEDGERKRAVKEDQIEGGGDDSDRDRDRDRDSRSSSTKKRREGDRVKAKVSGWTKYYSGEITRANSDGTYDIKFEDGERKRGVKEDQIEGGGDDRDRDRDRDRDSRSSSSTKTRREGDTVKAKCTGWTKYYAGEITRVNIEGT